jgi:hypothetical protein
MSLLRKRFVRERDAALKSLSVDRILAVYAKYGSPQPAPEREIIEIAMHKARLVVTSMTDEERRLSRDWLLQRGYQLPEESVEYRSESRRSLQ